MITLTDQILAMLEAGHTKPETVAHLRKLNPSLAPTWITKTVERVWSRERKRNGAWAQPEPATSG